MQTISRSELKRVISDPNDTAIVIETLPEEKYNEFHLPGAVNVPPGENFDEEIQKVVPNRNRKVIVYCWDENCDASEKAAKQLMELGYTNVYDYAEGKKAWKDAGLQVAEPATS